MNKDHIQHLHWLAEDVVKEILSGREFEVFTPDVSETGNIMHHIIRSADRSDIVVADTTGNNPNVLYEIAILDAMGRACIPVKLTNGENDEIEKMPFDRAAYRYFLIEKGNTQKAINDLKDGINLALKKQEEGELHENPLIDYFGSPLSSLASALGISRGYFRNFIEPALAGKVVSGPENAIGLSELKLEIVIPNLVRYGTREAVQELIDRKILIPVTLDAKGRKVNAFIWDKSISETPILVDVPTAFGQLTGNIRARLGKSANQSPESSAFKEIELDEITQFKRYLQRFIDLGRDHNWHLERNLKTFEVPESRKPDLFSS